MCKSSSQHDIPSLTDGLCFKARPGAQSAPLGLHFSSSWLRCQHVGVHRRNHTQRETLAAVRGVPFMSFCHLCSLCWLVLQVRRGQVQEGAGLPCSAVGNIQSIHILLMPHLGPEALEVPSVTGRRPSLCQLLGKYRCITCAGAAGAEVSVTSAVFHIGI